MDDMQLVMRVVSLGRAARSKAGIKVRQPLSRVSAFVATTAHAEGLRRQAGQVLEELNVKELQVFALIEAFKGPFERPKDLLAMLTPDDVMVEDDAGYAVAVNASVTPELAEEGLARELVHRIQNLRKAAGFDISDHITTYYQGPPSLRAVLAKHGDYVRQETLSEELVEGAPPDGAHAEESAIGGDGEPLVLAVLRRR
jgi:isoleucyl-tRNA synthetase